MDSMVGLSIIVVFLNYLGFVLHVIKIILSKLHLDAIGSKHLF